MSKYTVFDNDSKKKSSTTFGKLLTSKKREDDQFEILKMPQPYSLSSPYNKIVDFNAKTKAVCQKTDLSLFLDQCKVIFVGDCEVGKSSLIRRFTSSKFDQLYKATRDVDFESIYFEILNIGYNVGIWDLSGEERYKILNTPYYKNANVIVAVFDLTKPSSMINATRWMREALVANEKNDPIRFLVSFIEIIL
jgi:small GTP-binding protein